MRWKDGAAALSLANLVYLRLWAELLAPAPSSVYWLLTPPKPEHLIALMLNVLLLGMALWLGVSWLRQKRRWGRRATILAGLAILISLVNSLRTLIGQTGNSLFLKFVEQRAPALGVAVAILMILGVVFGGVRALRPVYRVLLLLSPFVLLSFGQAMYRIATYDPAPMANGAPAPRLPDKPPGSPRVIWVIFDEWDQNLTFPDRPSSLQLPEIDRLRRESLYAPNVRTAAMMTDLSMPALTMGAAADAISPEGPSELMVNLAGNPTPVPWSRQNNVFREARALGFNTAIVGWAIPYCRVLHADLTECWWVSGSNQYNSAGDTVPRILIGQPRSLYENIYRSPFGQSLSTHRHAWTYHLAIGKALEAVRNRGIGLTLIHLPLPHPPYFYNAADQRDDRADQPVTGIFNQTQKGYIDALALTDRSIGAIRRAMEQDGVWDSTTLIFSADHPFRHREALDGKTTSHIVPYIVKMAGHNQPLSCDASFSALLTEKLILAVLSKELRAPEQAEAWLEKRASEFPSR